MERSTTQLTVFCMRCQNHELGQHELGQPVVFHHIVRPTGPTTKHGTADTPRRTWHVPRSDLDDSGLQAARGILCCPRQGRIRRSINVPDDTTVRRSPAHRIPLRMILPHEYTSATDRVIVTRMGATTSQRSHRSARTYHRVLKLARTIADLEAARRSPRPTSPTRCNLAHVARQDKAIATPLDHIFSELSIRGQIHAMTS